MVLKREYSVPGIVFGGLGFVGFQGWGWGWKKQSCSECLPECTGRNPA